MMPPNDDQSMQSQAYLKDIYRAASERNLKRMEELLRRQQDPASIEATFTASAWGELAAEEKQRRWEEEQAKIQAEEAEAERRKRLEQEQWERQHAQGEKRNPWRRILLVLFVLLFLAICSIAGFIMGRSSTASLIPIPWLSARTGTPTSASTGVPGTPTSTRWPPTPTRVPPTPTPEPPTPVPPTPFTSRYYLSPETAPLYPALPVQAQAVWVLNDQDAIVDPPLTEASVWQPEQSQDSAANNEPFFSTSSGPASLIWEMDAPLEGGMYMLYVLDTLAGSGGAQAYTVLLDDAPAAPYRGINQVIFNTAQFGQQSADGWLPIGAYQVNPGQKLKVQANIEPRSAETPFAIDRLLLVRLTNEAVQMLGELPTERVLYSLVDDQQALYFTASGEQLNAAGNQPTSQPGDALAWNGAFKYWGEFWNADMVVEWAPAGRLPPGKYELYVWVPAGHATARGELALLADGIGVPRDNPAPLVQADFPNQWVPMGIWQIPQEAAVTVRFRVSQENNLLDDGTQAEIGADAVALVYVEP